MASRGSRSVVWWSWAVLGLLAAHDVTHLADDGLETSLGQLAAVALPQWLLLAVVMAVVVRGDPARSRLAALGLGAAVALGFAVIHLLPFAPADYWDLRPSGISWVLVWVPAAAGVVLAALAWPQRPQTA